MVAECHKLYLTYLKLLIITEVNGLFTDQYKIASKDFVQMLLKHTVYGPNLFVAILSKMATSVDEEKRMTVSVLRV